MLPQVRPGATVEAGEESPGLAGEGGVCGPWVPVTSDTSRFPRDGVLFRNRRMARRLDIGRDRILQTALGHLRQSGYAGMSLRDLARDAGLRTASLSHHFPSKEELCASAVQWQRQEMNFLLTRIAGDAEDLNTRLSAVKARVCPEDPAGLRLLALLGTEWHVLPERVRHEARDLHAALSGWLVRFFHEARAMEGPAAHAEAVTGARAILNQFIGAAAMSPVVSGPAAAGD